MPKKNDVCEKCGEQLNAVGHCTNRSCTKSKNNDNHMPESEGDLSKEQKNAINFKNDTDFLIRGMPGCRKTTVIVHRAMKFVADFEKQYGEGKGKILIVAFNKALISYVQKMIRTSKDLSTTQKNRIEVKTFHQMASSVLRKMGISTRKRATEREKDEAMRTAIARRKSDGPHRLLEKSLEFWKEEVQWMKGWMKPERETYINKMPRTGRGTSVRVTQADKNIIFDVYEFFEEELDRKGLSEWDDLALELYGNMDQLTDEHKYDHILIDEAQDFPPVWLITINKLARFSLTVAADVAQKIYKRAFSFKDCGIHVTGRRSRTLGKSYRCTKEIVALAQAFRDQMKRIQNSDELAQLPIPDHDGVKPVWIHRDDKDKAMRMLIDTLKSFNMKFNTKNLAILAYRNTDCKSVVANLKAAGLDAQLVKRDQLSIDGELIPVTTLHQVKGLEFRHVFIWGLRDSVIPGASLHYKDADAENEEVLDYGRALLYVAVTRAKEGVWMFSDSKTPSRFISELDHDLYKKL